jgi:uroporphyrin-III C-methyltransferase/precorrin-2 dehydrogenase/sirohydrochlorin ferrochelatase
MTGFVSLVGAGPGDPDLLTRKAARRLAEADLVLYDALVSPAALELAPRAQRFFVGKRSGRHSVSQETINSLMIRAARRGRRIVRLKCGDPFLLGRGGEEALALARAGVPFEVVPGISSAIAAPELAGIPVTHRGLASGFVVVSGHAPSAYGPILESVSPGSLTLVVLMGLANRSAIADLLLERGWPRTTPAAILLGASTPEASTWLGSIEELPAADLPEESRSAAGTIVIGEVVSLAGALGEVEGQSRVAAGQAVAVAGAGPRGLSPRR